MERSRLVIWPDSASASSDPPTHAAAGPAHTHTHTCAASGDDVFLAPRWRPTSFIKIFLSMAARTLAAGFFRTLAASAHIEREERFKF